MREAREEDAALRGAGWVPLERSSADELAILARVGVEQHTGRAIITRRSTAVVRGQQTQVDTQHIERTVWVPFAVGLALNKSIAMHYQARLRVVEEATRDPDAVAAIAALGGLRGLRHLDAIGARADEPASVALARELAGTPSRGG